MLGILDFFDGIITFFKNGFETISYFVTEMIPSFVTMTGSHGIFLPPFIQSIFVITVNLMAFLLIFKIIKLVL